MKCGVYCRVSTEGQKDNYSVQIQKQRGVEFAENNDYDYELYLDVESGSTNQRPAFINLIKDIEDGEIQAVWVIEFSRLSRNDEEDSLFIRRLFNEKSIKLYENGTLISFDSPEDQLFYSIRSSVAAYERRKIRQRMTAGLNQKYNKGMRVLPRVYGYDFDGQTVTVNEDEADVVKEVFQAVVDGKTYGEIAEDLIVRGKKRKGGKTNWSSGVITKMVRQNVYRGMIKAPSGEYIPSTQYEQIIPDELWVITQSKLKEKVAYKQKLNMRKGQFELSGLITCPECNARFFRKSNVKANGERGFYHHETSTVAKLECKKQLKQTTLDEKRLLYLVRAMYLKNFEDRAATETFYREEVAKLAALNQDVEKRRTEIEKHRKSLYQQKDRLIEAVLSGALSNEDVRRKREEIEDKIVKTDKELASVELVTSDTVDALHEWAHEDSFDFHDLTQSERKALYGKRIKSIFSYNRSLDVTFINDRTYHVDDIMSLDKEWQNRYDMMVDYYDV